MVNKQSAVAYAVLACIVSLFIGHHHGKLRGGDVYEEIHKRLSASCKKDVERVSRNLEFQWSYKDTE